VIVGVISDTHGLLRPQVVDALRDCDRILHAGDVGAPDILDRLTEIAPVSAIRGNIDVETWGRALPESLVVEVGRTTLLMIHNIADLSVDPAKQGFAAVIYGHSHKPSVEDKAGVLYFNPGSAGPRRFSLPISVGKIRISAEALEPELITL
jgi:uncharacterized protein